MQTISLAEAIAIIQRRDKEGKPFPFDVTYRTFNSQSKAGGKLKQFVAAKYLPDKNPNAVQIPTEHNIFDPVKISRKPSHYDNRTRNIELENGEIKKLRFDFIITVNNQFVRY
ncbi:hypothetical protein [Flavobacterium sp.]|uniref:hypothetical protein n=1 Tax=Flavobacterium sp. TaxID=239 RepID=UPI0011FD440C|nr:hypothetical protein [Flavobacterium sp.]RZJ71083.1 MAG: hypothetical protein EOO49_11560 [Flavobacterium sp.]